MLSDEVVTKCFGCQSIHKLCKNLPKNFFVFFFFHFHIVGLIVFPLTFSRPKCEWFPNKCICMCMLSVTFPRILLYFFLFLYGFSHFDRHFLFANATCKHSIFRYISIGKFWWMIFPSYYLSDCVYIACVCVWICEIYECVSMQSLCILFEFFFSSFVLPFFYAQTNPIENDWGTS